MSDEQVPIRDVVALLYANIDQLERLAALQQQHIDRLYEAVKRHEKTIENLQRQLGECVPPDERIGRKLWLIEHLMDGLS